MAFAEVEEHKLTIQVSLFIAKNKRRSEINERVESEDNRVEKATRFPNPPAKELLFYHAKMSGNKTMYLTVSKHCRIDACHLLILMLITTEGSAHFEPRSMPPHWGSHCKPTASVSTSFSLTHPSAKMRKRTCDQEFSMQRQANDITHGAMALCISCC